MSVHVPYRHQENNYFCGPTCLKMVFERFGVKKTEKDLAKLAGTNERSGTSHYGMIEACKKTGFSCFVHENSSLKNVNSFLRMGLPVIVDWTDSSEKEGHYTVVTEISDDSMVFCDPWYGPKHTVDKKTFEKFWHDGLTKGKKWMMVTLPKSVGVRQEISVSFGRGRLKVDSGRVYRP